MAKIQTNDFAKLKGRIQKLQELLEDPQNDHPNWHQFLRERMAELLDWYFGSEYLFRISKEEAGKFRVWLEQHNESCHYANPKNRGAIGGRFCFKFAPTTLGTATKVKCACGQEIDLTDYEDW